MLAVDKFKISLFLVSRSVCAMKARTVSTILTELVSHVSFDRCIRTVNEPTQPR